MPKVAGRREPCWLMGIENRGYNVMVMRTVNTSVPSSGVVSYRLTRHRAVEAFHEGRHMVEDICDATTELQRVARNCSRPKTELCPICRESNLDEVTFAFGPGLPASGRVVMSESDFAKLQHRGLPATCYSIEVCQQCWWNHLQESFAVSFESP